MRKEDGVIGQIAKQLVLKWKEIATAEYDNVPSDQQTNNKQINNKYEVIHDSAKLNVNNKSSSPDQNNLHNHLTNGPSMVKGEGNSSSSPSKPKIGLEEKSKKHNTPSKLNRMKLEQSGYTSDEASNIESKPIISSSKLNERLDVKKNKHVKNEKKTKENSPSNDKNIDVQKKCKSFEEMLMMPIFPTKKKKKKSEPSNATVMLFLIF